MRRVTLSFRWIRLALLVLVSLVVPQITEASCSGYLTDFGQLLPNCGGSYCYVVSPGLGTSQSLAGSFWSFGTGRPALGQGDDDGSLALGAWLRGAGTGLYISGDWQAIGIDGCIVGKTAPGKPAEIMVASVSDDGYQGGFFALASARRFPGVFQEFDFTFVAGGGEGHDIDLVEIPKPHLVQFTQPSTFELLSPSLSELSPGIWGDGSVTAGELVKGYRVYKRVTAPGSFRTSAGWTAVTGTVPFGQNAIVTVPWAGDLFLAYALVFESDFETAYVGRPIHVMGLCHPTDADGDGFSDVQGDPECCPDGLACDCNDHDPNVYPGALETCNGVDDNCDGTTDNVALPGSVLSLHLGTSSGSTQLDWTALAVATSYDVIRGDLTTLRGSGGRFADATQACVANDVAVNHADDALGPGHGEGFWYLIRASNCTGTGSYDVPEASQAAPRDAEIAASGHACP